MTPISFRVKKRGLRGFLAEADAEEDGKRLITGEWVINKRLWKRMQQTEVKTGAGGKDKVVLYLHGGELSICRLEFRLMWGCRCILHYERRDAQVLDDFSLSIH